MYIGARMTTVELRGGISLKCAAFRHRIVLVGRYQLFEETYVPRFRLKVVRIIPSFKKS